MKPSLLREGIVHHLDHPMVFQSTAQSWRCVHWSLDDWADYLEDAVLDFRIGSQSERSGDRPQWEASDGRAAASLRQLLHWTAGRPGKRRRSQHEPSPLAAHDPTRCWAYCAYKPLHQVFGPDAVHKLGIDWGVFGFPDSDAANSTFWLGTTGAHTLCHRDTYGCNLVVQLAGRKCWTLFPPSDERFLYPTRIPYEESTVFSAANLRRPDLRRFPDLACTHPHIVVLQPGEALLVPRHWWHLVENLETSISVNTWIDLEADHAARLEEALVRTLVSRLPACDVSHRLLLNDPTETRWSLEQCLTTLQTAAEVVCRPLPPPACMDKRAFWAAFRAWPGSRLVPVSSASALAAGRQPSDTDVTDSDVTRSSDAERVLVALSEALTEPAVVACAAAAFLAALRRRRPLNEAASRTPEQHFTDITE